MRCEWCEQEYGIVDFHGGLRYCSDKCRNRATQYAFEVVDSWGTDADPPSKDEFKTRCERARRWTPERMQERIDELTHPDV